MTTEQQFERELEIFRVQAETAAQFYSYLGIDEVAKRHKLVFQMLDENALFWMTVKGGLQTAALIAVGRIFDQDSRHNIDAVLRLAQQNREIFSKAALGKRKQGTAREQPNWLPDYLRTAHEPTPADFRRLRKPVKKYRRIYETNHRDLRNQYYAHKQAADPDEVATLVAKTSIREMQRLFVFLLQLHQVLQQLYANGHKPVLRPVRRSAQQMKQRPSPAIPSDSVHERILKQAEKHFADSQRRHHGGRRQSAPQRRPG